MEEEPTMKLNAEPCTSTNSSEPSVSAGEAPHRSHSDPSPQSWTAAERVELDLELPHIAIARALKNADDGAVWREYALARDQDTFVHDLARLAGSFTTLQTHFRDPSRTTEWHHSLIGVPFLLPADSWPVAAPSSPDRVGASSLMGELQQWAGQDQTTRLVLGCVKYADLVRWSPVTQQEYLRLLAAESTTVSAGVDGVSARIPDDAMQLAFAIGSVRCWNMLPKLPGSSDAADWELRVRMAACLSYMHQSNVPPEHVLSPAPLAEAVLAGLRLWIQELSGQCHVTRWDVRLGLKDVVYYELETADDQFGTIMLPIRRHQVGADGMPALMSDLAARFSARLRAANAKGAPPAWTVH
jgi:hypothetical protein